MIWQPLSTNSAKAGFAAMSLVVGVHTNGNINDVSFKVSGPVKDQSFPLSDSSAYGMPSQSHQILSGIRSCVSNIGFNDGLRKRLHRYVDGFLSRYLVEDDPRLYLEFLTALSVIGHVKNSNQYGFTWSGDGEVQVQYQKADSDLVFVEFDNDQILAADSTSSNIFNNVEDFLKVYGVNI